MKTRNKLTRSKSLDRALQRFERWRRTRTRLNPIPEALWASAVKAAQECGVNATAQTLRLDYNALKKRMPLHSSHGSVPSPGVPTFVELVGAGLAPESQCVLELEDVQGARMRITLKATESPDLVALSRAFFQGKA